MKQQSSASLGQERFLPVTVYEPHRCEHPGCAKLGLFGFFQRHQEHWFCYGHKEDGERACSAQPETSN